MKQEFREIYRATQLPVFQNRMFHTEVEAKNCTKGDVVLVQDCETGLIFNQTFIPELMTYDDDYQNEQAVSTVFQQHLHNVSNVIEKYFQGYSLIEVGCGKGHFLEQLQGMGFDIIGLDPTYEGSNTSVIKKYFTPEIGLKADGIILRHVLEHIQDPITFLSNLLEANGGSGKIYIEVPCFDWICDHRAWFDIFYEHVNYFRLSNFYHMFDVVNEAGHTFNGQYLYVVADLATIRIPSIDRSELFEFPEMFLKTVEQYSRKLRTQNTEHRTLSVVWGGASKGVIFALFMMRAGAKIDLVIDINCAKQEKYLAATGLKVWSPEEAMLRLSSGTDIFVMNTNYLNEIEEITDSRFNLIPIDELYD